MNLRGIQTSSPYNRLCPAGEEMRYLVLLFKKKNGKTGHVFEIFSQKLGEELSCRDEKQQENVDDC